MTISILFLLLLSWALFGEVHCLGDSSPTKLVLPHAPSRYDPSIESEKKLDKISLDLQSYFNLEKIQKKKLDNISREFQSYFNLEKIRKKKVPMCRVTIEASGRPDMFKLQFQRNSIFHKCNFSKPLHLNYNGLDDVTPNVLYNKILYNKLKELAGWLLEHNNLDSVNVTISQDSDLVHTLKLDMNNLFILDNEIFRDLKDLKTITLNENDFTTLPVNLFNHIKRLKTIELSQNKVNLTDLPPRLFSDLIDLKVVLLRNIGLHELTEDLFWGSHNLKEIDLSNNYLQVLPKNLLRDAHELRMFNISSNYLITLSSRTFIDAYQLNQLDLSNNYIRTLNSSDIFVGLHSLHMLNMGNNNQTFIHADAFIALPNLKIANFSGNHLNLTTGLYDHFKQVSPFRHCHFIEELYLSGNRISEIFSDWMMNHTKLRKLDLSGNNLHYLEANDLRFNSSELYVDLSNNNIEIVNLTQLEHIPKIANSSRNVVIDLNWNPIYCNCDVYSLVRYLTNETSDRLKPEDLNYVKLKTDQLYCASYKMGQLVNSLFVQVLTCGPYEPREDRLSSCPESCFCQIIPKFSLLKMECSNMSWIAAPNWINTWHIDYAYVDLRYNAVQRTPDITIGGYESPRELYLDLSGNEIDRIEDCSLTENLRELLLDDNKLTENDMEVVKLKAPKTITKSIQGKSWPCDYKIGLYQEYAGKRYKLNKPIDWDMNDFMCPDRTIYFHP